MHIVFLTTSGMIGGAERSLLDLIFSLREAQPNWQFTVIAGEAGPLSKACEEIGARALVMELASDLARLGEFGVSNSRDSKKFSAMLAGRVALGGFSALRYARRLKRLLNDLKPDLVDTNGLKMHVFAGWATPPHVPLVWHIHDYVGTRPLLVRLLRLFIRRCDAAVVNSDSVGKDFQAALAPRIPIHTVCYGIDLKEFSADGPKLDLDAACQLPPREDGLVRIGLVGTFGKHKGHHTFLEALTMLPSDLAFRAYVVGGPLYRTDASQWSLDDLKHHVSRLGLSDRVGFTGFVSNPAAAMRSLDIVVHATTQPEPFGLVIAEAMACRRALTASRAGGAMEVFCEGVNALGHAPGDAHDLAGAIVRLAGDSNLRRTLGDAGRQTAERYFNRERLGGQLISIYRSVSPLPSRQTA
jgi:glycosyltransferase involved in cell wall biosynthesis